MGYQLESNSVCGLSSLLGFLNFFGLVDPQFTRTTSIRFLPESPAFLVTKGKAAELKIFIKRANKGRKTAIKCNIEETLGLFPNILMNFDFSGNF